MSDEEAIVNSVVSRCLSKDVQKLIRHWGWLSEKDMKTIPFQSTKRTVAAQISKICLVSYSILYSVFFFYSLRQFPVKMGVTGYRRRCRAVLAEVWVRILTETTS